MKVLGLYANGEAECGSYMQLNNNAKYIEFVVQCLQDYIHRVGRTARAGRSGVAISIFNQYELEWYIQIEKLIGKDQFP